MRVAQMMQSECSNDVFLNENHYKERTRKLENRLPRTAFFSPLG